MENVYVVAAAPARPTDTEGILLYTTRSSNLVIGVSRESSSEDDLEQHDNVR